MQHRRRYTVVLALALLAGCAPKEAKPERPALPSAERVTGGWYDVLYRHEDATKGVVCYVCYVLGGTGISCVRTSPAPVVEDTTGGRR